MYEKYGGARKVEWYCSIETNGTQSNPMYINSRTQEKYPIFINKKGNLSYQNDKGLVKPVLNCNSEDVIKIFRLFRNPVIAPVPSARQNSVHSVRVRNSTKKKKKPTLIKKVQEYIDIIEQDKPLPNTKGAEILKKFCNTATRKNALKTPTPARANTPAAHAMVKTPTPARAKTPGAPARARMLTPTMVKTPTPARAKTPSQDRTITPTPVRARTPTPVRASTIRKQRCDGGQRCKKGTRCNKKTGYCEKMRKTKRNKSSVLRSKRKKDSDLDIMQAKESYKELGITENDFFDDVCLVLRNIRKKLHKPDKPDKKMLEWSKDKMYALHNLSPFITNKQGKQLTGKKVENRDLYLGPHLIHATDVIGKGGYGQIYKGTFGHKNCAIKQSLEPMNNRETIIDYYTEIIIQNELFCHAHRQALSQPKYAKIPKPYFMARLNTTPLLGMEPLDDSLYKFIKKSTSFKYRISPNRESELTHKIKMTRVITDMFECLCNTLILLQHNYEFYHRDMHAGNIMYRKQGESYQWFLIDFGFATFKMNDYRFNWEGAGPYGPFNSEKIKEGKAKGRVGHDLRLTLLYIFDLVEDQFNYMLLPDAFAILNMLFRSIKKSIVDNKIGRSNNFWHRGYEDAFNKLVTRETEPKVFLAETIPKLRAIIANAKGQSSVRRSSTKTRKEYVHVERKEGKLQTKKN